MPKVEWAPPPYSLIRSSLPLNPPSCILKYAPLIVWSEVSSISNLDNSSIELSYFTPPREGS